MASVHAFMCLKVDVVQYIAIQREVKYPDAQSAFIALLASIGHINCWTVGIVVLLFIIRLGILLKTQFVNRWRPNPQLVCAG
jgi:hypothetical protein